MFYSADMKVFKRAVNAMGAIAGEREIELQVHNGSMLVLRAVSPKTGAKACALVPVTAAPDEYLNTAPFALSAAELVSVLSPMRGDAVELDLDPHKMSVKAGDITATFMAIARSPMAFGESTPDVTTNERVADVLAVMNVGHACTPTDLASGADTSRSAFVEFQHHELFGLMAFGSSGGYALVENLSTFAAAHGIRVLGTALGEARLALMDVLRGDPDTTIEVGFCDKFMWLMYDGELFVMVPLASPDDLQMFDAGRRIEDFVLTQESSAKFAWSSLDVPKLASMCDAVAPHARVEQESKEPVKFTLAKTSAALAPDSDERRMPYVTFTARAKVVKGDAVGDRRVDAALLKRVLRFVDGGEGDASVGLQPLASDHLYFVRGTRHALLMPLAPKG